MCITIRQNFGFIFNCCVHAKQIDHELGIEVRNQPKEHECHFRKRIEKITGRTEDKFTIKPDTDLIAFTNELLENLNKALAFLEEVNELDELILLMIHEKGLHNYRDLLRFLIKTNRSDLAEKLILQLKQDFSEDECWPLFEQQIKEILATNR